MSCVKAHVPDTIPLLSALPAAPRLPPTCQATNVAPSTQLERRSQCSPIPLGTQRRKAARAHDQHTRKDECTFNFNRYKLRRALRQAKQSSNSIKCPLKHASTTSRCYVVVQTKQRRKAYRDGRHCRSASWLAYDQTHKDSQHHARKTSHYGLDHDKQTPQASNPCSQPASRNTRILQTGTRFNFNKQFQRQTYKTRHSTPATIGPGL
jgi:hypothetical protein